MSETNPANIENKSSQTPVKPRIHKSVLLTLVITAVLVLCADQLAKSWVSANLIMHRPINLIGSYLRIISVRNEGLIWGLPFKNNFSYYFLPIVGIFFIFYIALKSQKRLLGFIYGLILAGAVGNLIDRIRFGYVVDYIDMGIKHLRWPTYNIADLSIIVGIVMIFIYEIFGRKKTGA